MSKWLKIVTNKYVITLLLFFFWMSYFDNNNLNRLFNLKIQARNLTRANLEKKREIEMIKRSLNMLKDKKTLERFAREEYRFKKKGEEVFIIVQDE